MKTMKKIVAILAVALMLCSILPLSVFAADTYELASSLNVGDTVVLVCASKKMELSGISTTSTKYGIGVAYTTAPAGAYALTVEEGSTAGTYSFKCPNGQYLYWTSGNSLATNATKSANTSWTVTFTGDNAVIKNVKDSARILQWNASSPRFACYGNSGQTAVQLFKKVTEPEVPSTCEHVWEQTSTTAATCTTAGEEYYECAACGNSKTEAIEALGHSYGEATETKAPSCTTAGEKQSICSACNDVKTEVVNALDHNYVDGKCSTCGVEEPNTTTYTITFDANKTQREEFSTTKQVWKNGALTFTNNKAGAQSAVADYGAPVRLYKGSEIVVECIGMIEIVFDCNSGSYATALKNSIGDAATVSSDKVTVMVSENTFTIKSLSDQVRIDSITVTAEVQDTETCEHENAKECDVYCPDCGELISEGATHQSDAQFPCYEGKCVYCDEVIAAVDHVLDENDVCTVCGLVPTPEKPVDPENPQKYVFKDFAAGTQYAVNEKHFLDNAVTVITNKAHFTTDLRIYSSDTYNATVIIKSKKDISAIVLNAGENADVLNLYVSEDGEVYEAISVTSAYDEYTVLIPAMTKYIKLDVAGSKQVRIKDMTLYFDGEAPSVCTEHVYTGAYDATCNNCGETTREVSFPEANSVLTIAQIIEICSGMDSGVTTSAKYYVIGEIVDIYDDEYGNMHITDGTNILTIYGTYDADGTNGFKDMSEKPEVGNTVKLYGKIGPYEDKEAGTIIPEMKYAWIIEVIACEHEYDNDCDEDCNLCGEIREDAHTYTDGCDSECDVCEEYRFDAPHNLTYVPGVVPANCQETGYNEYWVCADCGAYFGDENASWQLNPEFMYYTGEHTRPEDAAPCAVVACTICSEDTYGTEPCDRGDVPACQDTTCVHCGDAMWAEPHSYGYDEETWESLIPLCQPGDCIYCGEHQDYIYEHENGSFAPCTEAGECAHGCGLQYPATGIHELDNPCAGGLCWMCWTEIPAADHVYDDDSDAECNVCGEIREIDEPATDIKYGDVNGDDAIDILDEALVSQYVNGWPVDLDEVAADVNGDGAIDILDEALISQYVNGWPVDLGPEEPEETKDYNDGKISDWEN